MNNDLISREKVTQDISEIFADVLICSRTSGTVSFDEVNRRVQECLKNQPTAYNVDKVVERLDKASDYYECEDQGREHVQMVDLVDAIEIVRTGGDK